MSKFDTYGSALPFAGFSVICRLRERNDPLFQEIYDHINTTTLRNCVTPLPPSSLHMTICDMFTVRDFHGSAMALSEAVFCGLSNGFAQLQQRLTADPICPEIALRSTTTEASVGILTEVKTDNQKIRSVREHIRDVLHSPNVRRYRPHITLAYFFESPTLAFSGDVEKLQNLLARVPALTLENAELVYFPDMTRYLTYR